MPTVVDLCALEPRVSCFFGNRYNAKLSGLAIAKLRWSVGLGKLIKLKWERSCHKPMYSSLSRLARFCQRNR
jgi:hypothetical protein